ncbi:MAG: 4-hydroxy-tetrahydrodipicolinate synthase [Rhodothermaceae bacterium]
MFKGTGTAIITPFKDDLSIDYEKLTGLIEYQINNGIDAIIVLGTTGEAPVINDEERTELISFFVEKVNKRVKIIVGTGTNDPAHCVKHNENAEKLGADGLLIVNPYYNKGTQRSIVEHFKYLDSKTNLPIILYNVPSRTGMNMLPETIIKIYEECKNVVGVKEASGDISQIAKLLAIKPEEFSVLSGNDDQTLPIMSMGGDGVISVFSNSFPKEMTQMVNAALKDNYKLARELHNTYLKMMHLIFIEASPMPIKYVMQKLDLCKNVLRLPLLPVTEESETILDKELQHYFDSNIFVSERAG